MVTIAPNMSTAPSDSNLSTALFGRTRRAILAQLYGHPDEAYYLRQLVRSAGPGLGAVQREDARLAGAGIIQRTARGRQVYYQANPACPLFGELKSLVVKTTGVGDVLREALAPLAGRIRVAFIYGSVARTEQRSGSDVDLMVIGDVSFGDVVSALETAQKTLGREINPTVYSPAEFRPKITVDYPFRFGVEPGTKTRKWGETLRDRFNDRVERFFPKTGVLDRPDGYIFARTVPCPDTKGHPPTPLVPDWHLLNPKGGGKQVVAEPLVGDNNRTWSVRIRTIGQKPGQLHETPQPTYIEGRGISLFTHRQIGADYIKAKAQAGEMKNALYALVIKTPQGLTFQPPDPRDIKVLSEAE
jgi:uncharacterized protein